MCGIFPCIDSAPQRAREACSHILFFTTCVKQGIFLQQSACSTTQLFFLSVVSHREP